MLFISVKENGYPNKQDGDYQRAVSILYSISYTLKMSYKTTYRINGFFKYIIPPLESFWWQDSKYSKVYTNKEAFSWISVIRIPDFVSKEDFDWAAKMTSRKKKIDCSSAEYLAFEEGLCVQIMHTGSFDE